MLVFQSKNTKVEWLETERVVVKTVLGFIQKAELVEVFEKSLETLQKYQATKWMSDNRKISAYTAEDAAWIRDVWFPKAIQSTWKFYAILSPENIIGKMQRRKNYAYYAENGIKVETFSEPESALAWLRSQG